MSLVEDAAAERTFDAFEGIALGSIPGGSPGEALRRVRDAKGLTLADAARHTRIAARHLESLETGDYRAFHARVYAVGFARTYARYLDMPDSDITEAVRAQYDEVVGSPVRFEDLLDEAPRHQFPVKIVIASLLALVVVASLLLAVRLG